MNNLIPKANSVILGNYNVKISLSKSRIYNVKRTPECKAGVYALMSHKDDEDKNIVFEGYISYNNVCEWFDFK